MPVATCPRCALRLTVSYSAPAWLTCPHCLAKVDNRAGASAGRPAPVPVIPIEQEVARDDRLITWGIVAVVIAMAIGLILLAMNGGAVPSLTRIAVTGAITLSLGVPIFLLIRDSWRKGAANASEL